jgi:polar amino acid transport system substrate-binding protein
MKKICLYILTLLITTFVTTSVFAVTKSLVIGTNAAYAPFEFINTKGKIDGFDIDLIKAVVEQAGFKESVLIKDMEFTGLIPSLVSKKIDVIAAGMVITAERQKAVSFTSPYADEGLVIVTTNDANFTTLEDLAGKKVGAEMGTTSADLAKTIKGAEVIEYDASDIFVNLSSKKVDAIIQTEAVAKYYIKTTKKNNLKTVGSNLLPTDKTNQLGFAVNLENKELLSKLEKALKEVKENGTFDKIYKKWFGDK